MGVFIRQRGNFLYLDYRTNGHRHTESLHINLSIDERQNKDLWRLAETIRVKKLAQIVSGEHGLLDPIEGKRSLVSYAQSIAEKQAPKNPLPKSLRYLEGFAGAIQLSAVTERWVESYREYLLSQNVIGASTASKYLDALKMVLRHAVRDQILPRNPAESVRGIVAPESVKIYLTAEEIEKLARTSLGGVLGAEIKKAFLFDCLTDLRISDIKSLRWGEIVRGEKWQIQKRQKKTGRVVAIPLNDSAVKIIKDDGQDLHHAEELIFPRITASSANTNQYLVSWAKSAGLEKSIGWHTARHTFATLSLEDYGNGKWNSPTLGYF